jgi:hypothetical protein
MDLLIPYTHHWEAQVITALSLISTLYRSVAHAKSPQFVFTRRFLATDFNNGDSSSSVLTLLLSGEYPTTELAGLSSQLTADWVRVRVRVRVTLRLAVYRQSVCLGASPLEAHDQRFFFFQLNSCANSPYVTSSLTRRWGCLLLICLAFRQVYVSHI